MRSWVLLLSLSRVNTTNHITRNISIFLFAGLCTNSLIDWNFYLQQKDDKIFYEGYKNSKFYNNGSNWVMGERIALGENEATLTFSKSEEGVSYPVGLFFADVLDKNG